MLRPMRLRFISLLFILMIQVVELFAQGVKTLPDDPRILKGSIPNGFKYYLIENDVRQGYADFYLIRKVGAVHESPAEKGFNAIIGEMGTEGTRNFPNHTISTYFDELGLDSSSDFKISNGLESSFYRVENIPVSKGGSVIDSTLLILYNWAVGINLDEEEVEVGKKFYKNSLAKGSGTPGASELRHLNDMVAGDTSDILDQIDQYKAKDLRSFYYKWFCPERMAMVVVGDIDKGAIESKIKSLFQALPKYLDQTSDYTFDFIGHEKPLVSIAAGTSQEKNKLTIYFTTNPLPQDLRGSAVPFVEEYMSSMLENLLSEKLLLLSEHTALPFYPSEVSYGKFAGTKWKDALKMELVVSSEYVKEVADVVMRMVYNIKNEGFSQSEFERVSNLYFRDLNYKYDWRIFTPSRVYARRAISHFLDNFSLASVEMKKEYMDLARSQVNVSNFNMFVSSFFRTGDNCIVTYSTPRSPEEVGFSEGDLEQVLTNVIESSVVSSEVSEVSYSPLEYKSPLSEGRIVSEYPDPITDSKVWILSNGATVIYKRTQAEPKKFVFEAVSKGGLTLLEGNNSVRKYINEIAALSSVGGVSPFRMAIHKKNENIALEKRFDLNTTALSGNGNEANLDAFIKMTALHFTPSTIDKGVLGQYTRVKGEELVMRGRVPELVFDDTLSNIIYNKSKYISTYDVEDFRSVNYTSAISFINERFSNAANFHFIFAGDIDESELRRLVTRHLATLPGNQTAKENWKTVPIYLKKQNQRRVMEMDSDKNLYNITLVAPAPYSTKGMADVSLSSEIIKKRVTGEMKSKGFPVEVVLNWIKFPEEFLVCSFSSVTMDYTSEFEETMNHVLAELIEGGATEAEVRNAKNVLVERCVRGEKENLLFWKDVLVDKFIYSRDFSSKYVDFIKQAGKDEVNQSIRSFLQNGVSTVLILKNIDDDDKHNSDR